MKRTTTLSSLILTFTAAGALALTGCEAKSTPAPAGNGNGGEAAPEATPATAPAESTGMKDAIDVDAAADALAADLNALEDASEIVFNVQGMTCMGCVANVKQRMTNVPGVVSCDISLENKSAVVKVTDPKVAEKIMAAVNDAQFHASVADDASTDGTSTEG